MKAVFSTTLALAIILCSSFTASKKDEQAVIDCFNGYQTAFLASEGKKAVAYVNEKSISYYEKLRIKTLSANKKELDKGLWIEKITVILMRNTCPKETLKSMNGKTYLEYAISKGFIAKDNLMGVKIEGAEVKGKVARGKFTQFGPKAPYHYEFTKEAGEWKIDLTSVLITTEMMFQASVKMFGVAEDEITFFVIKQMTGEEPSEDIWKPLE